MNSLLNNQLIRFTNFRYWKEFFALCLPIIVLFFAFPSFKFIPEHWEPILLQAKNPFIQHSYPDYSHASKLAFRFIPAIIIGLFGLSFKGIILWQYLNGILLFYLVGLLVEKKTNNKLAAFYSMLILAFIFTGKVSFINFKDTFDSFILSLILLCFLYNKSIFIFFVILVIGFTDERGLISSGFIFLYLLQQDSLDKKNSKIIAIILSWLTYFLIRFFLSIKFGMTTSTGGVDLETLILNLNFAPLSFWQIFEGAWVIAVLFLIEVYKRKFYFLVLYIIQLLIIAFISFLVFDVTRSMVYEFPFFIISVLYLSKRYTVEKLNYYLKLSMFISFLYPAYCSGGTTNIWSLPLPIKIAFNFFTNS